MYQERAEVRPRFRCLVCRRFVEGTEQGTCPRCAWQPPRTTPSERRSSSSLPALSAVLLGLVALLIWVAAR